MMSIRRPLIYFIAISTVLLLTFASWQQNDAKPFHTRMEREFFETHLRNPIDSDQYFLGSIRCKGCHGFDTLHVANIDGNGVDINLYDDWQSSMMANASKDPLWRAKVSHEILVNPSHALELQTKCTSCHAPMGHFTAVFHGANNYTLTDLADDTLGLDGVSCGSCHEIGTENLGLTFSGNIPYDTSRKEFGPFVSPLVGPMQLYVGLIPTYSEHMNQSKLCSSCHTLLTNTIDSSGNYTGNVFIEQATYHEWLNSALAQDNITCQHCHMPQVTDSVVIANNILSLPPRSPFNQHQFVGGNAFMVNMIKENKNTLGIDAPDVNFDSTLAATYRMLQEKSLNLALFLDSIVMDTLYLRVRIVNKAGHKFPSGYPSRRAVVQLVVTDPDMDTVFQSGTFNASAEVNGIDPIFEPHYNVINKPSQAQIYEMVMGDVNDHFTTVIEYADHILKDNRIPPEGFVSTHPDYDTVQVIGDALNDPDFNKDISGSEGTGMDIVHFHVPVNGFIGAMNVYAAVYYQSVPPKWVSEMFNFSSDAIDSFKNMYLAADKTPFLVASAQLITPVISSASSINSTHELQVLNNPTQSGTVTIENKGRLMVEDIQIYPADGSQDETISINKDNPHITLNLPKSSGIYLIQIRTKEKNFVFKVLRL